MKFGKTQQRMLALTCSLMIINQVSSNVAQSAQVFSFWHTEKTATPRPPSDSVLILVDHLDRFRGPQRTDEQGVALFDNSREFFVSLLNTWNSTGMSCNSAGRPIKCMRSHLKATLQEAQNLNLIDQVTFYSLNSFGKSIDYQDGQFGISGDPIEESSAPTKDQLTTRELRERVQVRLNRKQKRLDARRNKKAAKRARLRKHETRPPLFSNYMHLGNALKHQRLRAGAQARLDEQNLSMLTRLYRRKIKRIGPVSPDQYVISAFSRTQINVLSDLMRETIHLMTWQSGRIVAMPSDYLAVLDKIEMHEEEVADLIDQAAVEQSETRLWQLESEIDLKSQAIHRLRSLIVPMEIEKQIDELQARKRLLTRELFDAGHSGDAEVRMEKGDEIVKVDRMISELRDRKNEERIEIQLPPSELRRIAQNHLKNRLETEVRTGTLRGTRPDLGDVVIAAYLTGELDDEVVEAVMSLQGLNEPHTSSATILGRLALSIGGSVALIHPASATIYTLGMVVLDSVKRRKAYEIERSRNTHLTQ